MWKKIIAWILCVCILTQSFPLNAASVSRIARGTELRAGGSQMNLTGTGEDVFLSESTSDKGVVYSVDENGKLVQEETKKEKDSSDKKKGESTGSADTETGSSGSDDGKDGDRGKGDAATGSTGTETGSAGSSESDADKTAADKTDEGKTDADKNDADKTGADKIDADKTGADKTDADKTDADKNDADKTDAGKTDVDKTDADKDTSDAGEGSLNSGTVHKNSAANALKDQDGTDGTSESGQDGQDNAVPELYDNGAIRIYNLEQLRAIGTDTALTDEDDESDTFGSGEAVTVDGTPVTYSLDGQYVLMNDITLDSDALWQLPEGFAGTFASDADSETTTVDENAPLYDKATDTIYIYNNYQLMTMALDTAAKEPVMSRDMIAEDFGVGQLVYPDGAPTKDGGSADETAQDYLTYSPEHNYVLVQEFTGEMPEMKAEALADDVMWLEGEQASGRTVPGQLYVEEAGKKYILIGNEAQLRAIGSNKHVTPRIYVYNSGGLASTIFGGHPTYTPYYPGDADLGLEAVAEEGGTTHKEWDGLNRIDVPDEVTIEKYTYYEDHEKYELADVDLSDDSLLEGLLKGVLGILGGLLGGTSSFCGVDETGRPNHEKASLSTLKNEYGELYYSSDADYIIFRDINLNENGENSNGKTDDWTPINISGNIEGRKNMVDGTSVEISNIHVYQGASAIDPSTTRGFGFFGSISSQSSETDLGSSAGTTVVEDIHLKTVSVDNDSTEVAEVNETLVEGLLNLVGGLLGDVLGVVEDLLGNLLGWVIPGLGDLKLSEVVEGLLKVQKESPDIFAAGSFAGRVIGDVKIQNCTVTEAGVTSAKGMTGGFVGYTEGEAQYSLEILGDAVETLANLLNIIPGLGLGDLITVLLENDVALGDLLPIGYYNPQIINCNVSLKNGGIGNEATDYNGGFVGIQNATKITDCTVSGLASVQAGVGAGGFAGLERDAVVDSLLTELDVELYTFDIQSTQTDCTVEGTNITVSAKSQYAGGFNGVMTNSVSHGCSITELKKVNAGKYAGGFSGRATIGYGTTVGGQDEKNNTLLSSVTKLLEQLVAPGQEDALSTLLALSGLTPSELYDCSVSGTGWTVEASGGDYAGGFIGQGDGVKISSKDGGAGNKITGLSSVKAENYAGGIAGSAVTANPIGVLNNTLGVGSYLPFEVSSVTLEGEDLSVTAEHKCASGGLGLAIGGTVDQVSIKNLSSVKASNYAGGLAGRSGTGGLVKEGGLDLLGLGAVKVDNLLSLMEGVEVNITDSRVAGTAEGMAVQATGEATATDKEDILAGGFIAEAEGVQIGGSAVSGLKEVSASSSGKDKKTYAAGFVGRSHTGGLAGIAEEGEDGELTLPGIANVSSLLDLVPYLLPTYTGCSVSFASNGDAPQVQAQYAGGFFGSMESGQVNNSGAAEGEEGAGKSGNRTAAVQGLEYVKGTDYAGGFAGRVDAGAAASSDGLSLLGGVLKLELSDLVSVLSVYIPEITSADVQSSENGLMVKATAEDSSAGGYIGYGSGVQIDDSNVGELRHTKVTPPSDSLESGNESNYFDPAQSSYAVKGGQYAGGYIGCADIGSAAKVGGGLGILGDAITITDITEALDVVCTSIKDSNVTGAVGGYSVLANGTDGDDPIGMAGGYAGKSSGTQITNSDALNFAYIIGQENAGGYAGMLEPGNVASVLEGGDILNNLLSVDSLLSVMQSFIPIIETSQATSIPCGGAVRAQGMTTYGKTRGLAGGYVGYNHGGRIQGSTEKECAVVRLRSVYGGEFAGGFTGLMENAAVADAGNLELLFGLVSADNILGLLQAVYPTETNTAVYGPLRNVDLDTWNAWATAVGANGVYGYQFPAERVETEEELAEYIKNYAYGYNVKAGRSEAGSQTYQAGVAGGYAGRISGGVVTEAHAWDGKDITAYKSAGGFAGEMLTEGAAEIGKVEIAGLPITGALSALQTFVPVIRNSDVTGYQSGMSIKAVGVPEGEDGKIEKAGYAGGFVGHMVGGQIWGNWTESGNTEESNGISTYSVTDAKPDPNNDRCFVANLRRVDGTQAVGGFAGQIDPGSAAALDTAGSEGLLGGLLQGLIGTPGDLLEVLNATVSTVRAADVKAWDDYGIVVNGVYFDGGPNTSYAKAAGGFAGEINGAVVGELDHPESGIHVENIRSVTGGEHAGGFFGLADVSAVAEISGEGETSILGSLLKLGAVDVLDAFRTYIYDSSVSGTEKSGLEVHAHTWEKSGLDTEPVYTGNAGGFGGTLLNGSVKGGQVTNLREVEGLNYTGGFIGHLGKSGVVDLDKLGVLDDILGVSAGVLDVFGSHVENSSVTGLAEGFTVKSRNAAEEKQEIAGGFAGYADLAKLDQNTVANLKQVASEETAGGFAGQTSFAYLADISADSPLVNALADRLNTILKALWIENLENGDIIKIDLGILEVDALYDGELVHLNLLGLDISIALAKDKQLATVYIGDSKIEIKCAEDGSVVGDIANELQVSLIKANRTRIRKCQVTGIPEGYDVYGGNAGNDSNGSGEKGYAGGFVGFNDEGLLERNQMYLADVIRGTKGITGPFTGSSSLESNWDFNTLSGIEGNGNQYRIYREADAAYNKLLGSGDTELQDSFEMDTDWNIYTITHMAKGKVEKFTDLENAVMSNGSWKKDLNAYMEDGAMAVLMDNTPTEPTEPGDEELPPDAQDPCTDTVQLRIQKFWKGDSEENRQEIVLHITRSYKDSEGHVVQDNGFEETVTLNKQDYQSEDTWEKILSGQPYTAYHVGENGEKYYYTYTVSEDALEGYETTISYSGEYHYTIKIVNKRQWFDSLLPDTGGMGTAWIYMIGVLLLCSVAAWEYRKRKVQRRQNNYK